METKTSSGISLGSLIFLTFLILKLTNTIDWSWWWVTSPLWIPFVLITLIMLIIFILCLVSTKMRKEFLKKL